METIIDNPAEMQRGISGDFKRWSQSGRTHRSYITQLCDVSMNVEDLEAV